MANIFYDRRRELGTTQGTLAKVLKVTAGSISNWEKGRGLPRLSLIRKLAEVYQVDLRVMAKAIVDLACQDPAAKAAAEAKARSPRQKESREEIIERQRAQSAESAAEFLAACCDFEAGATVFKDALLRRYSQWTHTDRKRRFSNGSIERAILGTDKVADGGHLFLGIRLRPFSE
jgi:transcriptional regulator with XRE-family HTH domain